MSVVDAARRLVEQRPGHPVISVYLDLDPERFATAPARASQVRSLIDQAARELERSADLGHADRVGAREDLERVRDYLLSRQPPYKGARALAVFCCSQSELFEVVQLRKPVAGQVVVEPGPYVEPLIASAINGRWCVALVNRREGRVLTGEPEELRERRRVEDDVHGQHDQGGWSQANYQRSVEKDAEDHIRRVADALRRRWQAEHFDRLALGGPVEIVPRLEALLSEDMRARLVPERVDVDLSSATEQQVREAVGALVEEDQKRREREALDRLEAGLGGGGRAAAGPAQTIEALNERRVEVLLMEPGFDRGALRCPACGMLLLERDACPADGSELETVVHLREAAVEAAIAQDAEVIAVRRYPDLGPHQGIAALLRF